MALHRGFALIGFAHSPFASPLDPFMNKNHPLPNLLMKLASGAFLVSGITLAAKTDEVGPKKLQQADKGHVMIPVIADVRIASVSSLGDGDLLVAGDALKLTGSDFQAKFKSCRALAVDARGTRLNSRQVAEMLTHGPGFAVICSKKSQPKKSDPRFRK